MKNNKLFFTIILIGVSALSCIDDECDNGEAQCDGQVAKNCSVQYSDSHSPDNPYVWFTNDCSQTQKHEILPSPRATCKIVEQRATCVNENTMPQPDPTKPIQWRGEATAIGLDKLEIIAQGKTFTAQNAEINFDSDDITSDVDAWPIQDWRTTIELDWVEHDMEMRLYFYINEATDLTWHIDEIWTYGADDGEWIYYTGPFGETEFGAWFEGNLNAESDNPSPGTIHIEGLQLRAFW